MNEVESRLASMRILVVEDSPVVAEVLEEMLLDFGCEVVGPVGNMALALERAQSERLDAAVIDLNIRGGKVYPVARVLGERGIPFLLASGYADWTMPPEWEGRPRLLKPFTAEALSRALEALLAPPVAS
jgi:CheY-like chemotaxis protein